MVGWPVANVAATTAGFRVIYLLQLYRMSSRNSDSCATVATP